MTKIRNYLPSSLSTPSRSGGDGDGPSSIAQLVVVAIAGMVLLSTWATPVAAGSATGLTADNYTEGDASQTATVEGLSLNSSEITNISVTASGIDYTSVSESNITISGANMTLQGISTAADGELVFQATADESISGSNITISIDGEPLVVNSDGTDGTFSVDPGDDGTKVQDSFSYSLATGSIEISSVTESDTGNETNFDFEVINSSGSVVASGTNNSAPTTVTGLETGDYTVDVYGVDGYQSSSQTASVTKNNTTSLFYSLDPKTGTVELGNISTWDGGSPSSVDVMIYDSSGNRVVNQNNISDFDNWSTTLDTGDYTYTVVADGYADADGNFSVTENTTTALNPSFGPLQVDYEFEVLQDGEAHSNFTFNLYSGSSINDSESPTHTYDSSSVGSNNISVSNLDDGSTHTLEVVWNDSDGNEQTYTKTFTVNSSEADNGTIYSTVDVGSNSSDTVISGGGSSDDGYDTGTLLLLFGGGVTVIAVIFGYIALFLGGFGRARGR